MADQSLRAAYLEDWLDTIEALPVEVQRNFSLIRELDANNQDLIRDIRTSCDEFMAKARDVPAEERRLLLQRLTAAFTRSLKHGESKVTLAMQTYDMFDKHIRRLDEDLQKFEDELLMTGPKLTASATAAGASSAGDGSGARSKENKGKGVDSPAKRRKIKESVGTSSSLSTTAATASSSSTTTARKETGNKKERRPPASAAAASTASAAAHPSPLSKTKMTAAMMAEEAKRHDASDAPIDPNEPTYCICGQVSYGAMIGCDNEDCDVEWFHYACVGLDSPPKGKWYCQDCQERLGLGA